MDGRCIGGIIILLVNITCEISFSTRIIVTTVFFKMHFFSEYRCDDLDLQISALGNYQRRGDRPYSRRVQIIKNLDRRVQLGRANGSPFIVWM